MPLETVQSLAIALGIGLLIGLERERKVEEGERRSMAGVRSFALLCLLGAVAVLIGGWALPVALLGVVALSTASYLHSGETDPGITTEVAAVLAVLLGALAISERELAAGLGVLVALLLASKAQMHRLSRELISDAELHDGLLLAAAALIVLPLLPDRPIGPYGVLNPYKLWLLVVLFMAIAALGHVLLRLLGGRWGWVVAGFFAGYVSSTAATAEFGQRARAQPQRSTTAAAAALLASAASISLFIPLLSAVAPGYLRQLLWPLGAALAVCIGAGALGLFAGRKEDNGESSTAGRRMFRLTHALYFAGAVAAVLLLSSALNDWLGPRAVLVGTAITALAEAHASALSLGQMEAGGVLSRSTAMLGFLGVLAASSLSKSVIAWISGGSAYGLRVSTGLVLMTAAAALATWWSLAAG